MWHGTVADRMVLEGHLYQWMICKAFWEWTELQLSCFWQTLHEPQEKQTLMIRRGVAPSAPLTSTPVTNNCYALAFPSLALSHLSGVIFHHPLPWALSSQNIGPGINSDTHHGFSTSCFFMDEPLPRTASPLYYRNARLLTEPGHWNLASSTNSEEAPLACTLICRACCREGSREGTHSSWTP